MAESQRVLTQPDPPRTSGARATTPATLADVSGLLIVAGLVLSLSGWVDIGLFYFPALWGQNEWEFGTIAQTFDALPLPTVALVLLAIGVRARGWRPAWTRVLAVGCWIIGAVLLVFFVIFLLDVPVAWQAMTRPPTANAGPPNPVVLSGMKRGMAKMMLFGAGYTSAYIALGVMLWRSVRTAR